MAWNYVSLNFQTARYYYDGKYISGIIKQESDSLIAICKHRHNEQKYERNFLSPEQATIWVEDNDQPLSVLSATAGAYA